MSPPTLADATPRDSDTSGDNSSSRRRVQSLLSSAKRGDRQSIGELLSQYRTYLTLLGAAQFRQRLRPRVSPSDIVQDVMLRAHCHFGQFRGHTEPELLAWLREILLNSLARFVEQHLHAAKRDIRREISLDHFADSAVDLPRHDLPDVSPAAQRDELEQAEVVGELLEQLPIRLRPQKIPRRHAQPIREHVGDAQNQHHRIVQTRPGSTGDDREGRHRAIDRAQNEIAEIAVPRRRLESPGNGFLRMLVVQVG